MLRGGDTVQLHRVTGITGCLGFNTLLDGVAACMGLCEPVPFEHCLPSYQRKAGQFDVWSILSQKMLPLHLNMAKWGATRKQRVVLTINLWMGGKNLFLGVVYLVVAGLAFIAALGFLICYHLGTVRYRSHLIPRFALVLKAGMPIAWPGTQA